MGRVLGLVVAAVVVGGMCAGCVGRTDAAPEAVVPTSNAAYRLERLFTDDGGRAVYRFRDRGEYRYYVAGPGGPQMVPSPTRPAADAGPATPTEPN